MRKIKKRNKQKALSVLVIVIAAALLITVGSFIIKFLSMSYDTVSLFVSIAEASGLIISLFLALKQLEDSKEIARADFLVELNSAFVNNQGNMDLYTALQDCVDGKCKCENKDCQNCGIHLPKVVISNYLTFYETIYLLLCNGVITFEMIDDLFAYRFFLAVHSQFVQQQKLATQPENFKNIFCLEHKWLLYRKNKAHKIDKPDSVYQKLPLKNLMKTEAQKQIYAKWLEEA